MPGGPSIPDIQPTSPAPTRVSPEIAVSKEEVKMRQSLKKGRAASKIVEPGFLESANIFRMNLKDSLG